MPNATRQTTQESGGDQQIGKTIREGSSAQESVQLTEVANHSARKSTEHREGTSAQTDNGTQTREQTGSQINDTTRAGSEESHQKQESSDQSVTERPQITRRTIQSGGGQTQNDDIGFQISFTWTITG